MDYTLYLDESGDFNEVTGLPSIIAGYLVNGLEYAMIDNSLNPKYEKDDKFGDKAKKAEQNAYSLLKRTQESDIRFNNIEIGAFHAKDEDDKKTLYSYIDKLINSLVADSKNKIVVFENEKNRRIISADITYLNVMAEGIIKLLEKLAEVDNGEKIKLKVIFAKRLNTEKSSDHSVFIIKNDEYKQRIQEKLNLMMHNLPDLKRKNIVVEIPDFLSSARESKRLMIADAICFAYRGGRCKELRELVTRCLEAKGYHCFVNKQEWQEDFNDCFESKRISEALYKWYTDFDLLFEDYRDTFEKKLVYALKFMSAKGRNVQFNALSDMIGVLIDIRDFTVCNRLIKRLIDELIPLLRKNDMYSPEFLFDLKYYYLTIATHQGNTGLSDKTIKECNALLREIKVTADNLEYFIGYQLRVIEHLKNIYDFETAITELNKLETIQRKVIALLSEINMKDGTIDEKSNLLGRIYGSRLLARIYGLKKAKNAAERLVLYYAAINDSNDAIKQFTPVGVSNDEGISGDVARQYQYRCMLEYEMNKFREAYSNLAKSYRKDENIEPEELLKVIFGGTIHGGNVFGIFHYVNIVAKSMLYKKEENDELHKLSQKWFAAIINTDGLYEAIKNLDEEYPNFLIQWRIATCLRKNNHSDSNLFYTKALASIKKRQANFTNISSGLAMQMERIALSDPAEVSTWINILSDDVATLVNNKDVPGSMREYFYNETSRSGWKNILSVYKSKVNGNTVKKKNFKNSNAGQSDVTPEQLLTCASKIPVL